MDGDAAGGLSVTNLVSGARMVVLRAGEMPVIDCVAARPQPLLQLFQETFRYCWRNQAVQAAAREAGLARQKRDTCVTAGLFPFR